MFKKLSHLIDVHLSTPFPSHSNNEKLEEWIFELTELDGHYMGIATSVLNSKKAIHIDLEDLKKMREKLNSISTDINQDKEAYEACQNYINSIEKIILEINQKTN